MEGNYMGKKRKRFKVIICTIYLVKINIERGKLPAIEWMWTETEKE